MNICILAQMLATMANAHHDARISSVEMIQAAQWAQAQCEVEQKKAPKK